MSDVALHPLDYISLCTGGGGLDLGVELAVPGARAVLMVEREAFAVAHLVDAMEQGLLAPAPVWSDARTLRGRRWRGLVDGVIGGIPCQPHSLAGKRLGRDDERDLWSTARRIIVQSGAWWVLIENVGGMLSSGGAERVWRDLQRLGFAVEGGLFRASEVRAPHERERLFILGVADGPRIVGDNLSIKAGAVQPEWAPRGRGCELADARGSGLEGRDGRAVRHEQSPLERGGEELGDSARDGRREGRSEPVIRGGRGAAGSPGLSMVDALGRGRDGRADEPQRGPQGRTVAEQPGEDGELLADSDFALLRRQPPARELAQLQRDDGLGLFPPGPGDRDGWADVLARAPGLEPAVRRMADGLADRVDRLRMLGNGVVPLQAAYALRTLATDLARRSAGAERLVRMMREDTDNG